MHFRKLIPLVLYSCLVLSGCESAGDSSPSSDTNPIVIQQEKDFIPVMEYLTLHPEQKEISEKFRAIVQEEAVPLQKKTKKSVSIAFVYPGEQASDYWRRSVTSFVKRMDALNIDYRLNEFFSKGGGVEVLKQEQQLREVLEQDPDYLVFTLDVNRHKPFIERILARGHPTLILQNITTPLSIWEKNQPYYVGFDHGIGTRMLADYFLTKFDAHHRYGMLYYSEGYVSKMRGDTFVQYMREDDGPSLLTSYYTDGQLAKAKQATLDILQESEPHFFYACSTDVAFGAIEGLKEKGKLGEILVNGWGGGSAELAAIERGELAATVMRMNDDNGVAMAEIIHLRLLGKKSEVPTLFSGEFTLITPETSAQTIEKLKKQAFRYSGKDTK
jgi:autoinducer 2-binding periplasmic protein LuxP